MAEPEFPESSHNADGLKGWKEIAAFIGQNISVRTAQRYERKRGLPVRRRRSADGGGAEIVYALKSEIAAWKKSGELREDTQPAPPSVEVQARHPTPHLRWLTLAVAAITVLGGAIYLTSAVSSSLPKQPADARIEGRALVVLNATGERLWTRELEFEPILNSYATRIDSHYGMHHLFVTDLDGDGSNEVVLSVASSGVKGAHGYRVFNADGTPRFAIEPSDRVTFGEEEYAAPWSTYRTFIIDNPDGSRSIWTAFIHSLWFPSLLLEVDHNGRIKSRYWSNGYVEQVEVAMIAGRRRVFVAATHNDSRGASLAIFDYGKVTGSAPATRAKYQCRSCNPGGPDTFLVFPRQCIAEALGGQATGQQMRFDTTGRLFIFIGEGPRNPAGDFAAGIWYTVAPEIEKSSMQFATGTFQLHQRLEKEGRLDHGFSSPVHLSEPGRILKWDGSAFRAIVVENLTPTDIAPRR